MGSCCWFPRPGGKRTFCPFGRVELMRSRDGGENWSFPRVVIDGPIDDRDAGVVETAAGSLLITTFTSVAYEERLRKALAAKPGSDEAWPEEKTPSLASRPWSESDRPSAKSNWAAG